MVVEATYVHTMDYSAQAPNKAKELLECPCILVEAKL